MKTRRKLIQPKKKIIAVDFDGTLVHNRYPFIENPNIELIEFIKENRDKYIWILWTCRTGKQLAYATKYMEDEYGIVFDYVNENCKQAVDANKGVNSRKVYADHYVDDKTITWRELVGDSNENTKDGIR